MPDESKNKQKGKHEAKEQRRKRQSRQQAGPVERKQEKEPETSKATASEKPAYQPPGPEFYQGLKRETDEILKISEEENSKYRNKEIQSNWAKYEMPIESYDEMVEKEQLGADYETLIQAPLSVGTHFQFKHEKSWDVTSGPSPYQKYFDIDMGNLIIALSTIPFYERNTIDKSIFTNSDFLSMDQRATKYKQKYNDSKLKSADLATQIPLSNKNTESVNTVNSEEHTTSCDNVNEQSLKEIKLEKCVTPPLIDKKDFITDVADNKITKTAEESIDDKEIEIKHLNHVKEKEKEEKDKVKDSISNDKNSDKLSSEVTCVNVSIPCTISKESEDKNTEKEPKKPIIESPEDLEKWLDDFLDN